MIESESHNLRLNMLNSLNTFKTFWLSEEAKPHYLLRTMCDTAIIMFSIADTSSMKDVGRH